MDANIIIAPIVKEVVSVGKGILLSLTDSAKIAVYGGAKIATSIMQDKIGISSYWMGVTVPIHLANRSKLERCLLRYFTMELVGLGDIYTPFDGDVKLIGDYEISSLDFIQQEAQLSAKVLHKGGENEKETLMNHRTQGRSVLESVLIEPQELKSVLVEFRCPLGESYPEKFEGGFRISIFADIIFPSVVSKEKAELLTFDHRFCIDMIVNTVEISTLEQESIHGWEKGTPLGESLTIEKNLDR